MQNTITKIVMQTKGISKTHPILLLKNNGITTICSIASTNDCSIFDYSIMMNSEDIPFDKSDESIILALWNKKLWLEYNAGWELAIQNGITEEMIKNSISLIKIEKFRRLFLRDPKQI